MFRRFQIKALPVFTITAYSVETGFKKFIRLSSYALRIRRKNEEYIEIFSTMPGDFKGTVFQKY